MPNTTPSIQYSSRGLFVTGTDTQVGKTIVTAALGIALQRMELIIGVMKPIETGIESGPPGKPNDGTRLHQLLTPKELKDLVTPYRFKKALAPVDAARQANSTVQFEVIAEAYHTLASCHEYMLVEGVGGVMVPLTEQYDVRDLIKFLQLPCILVSRTALGAVNHTRLTLAALRDYGIPILGIVLNETRPPTGLAEHRIQQESTVELLRQLCQVPIFGPIPFQTHVEQDWEAGVTILSRTPAIGELASMIKDTSKNRPFP
ncbi:MAG: dethiobiotin synthase [Nitrospirota bacterium]|nr:dethiobiotin synthase [Nitrospirota bacterium]